MNTGLRIGLLCAGLGLALQAGHATAAVATFSQSLNAVNACQAFTPGPANTIRNRVVGSENIGATMNVACSFAAFYNGAGSNKAPKGISMYFSNNGGGTLTVTCSLLTGYQGQTGSSVYLVTKTSTAATAGGSQGVVSWGPTDNPVAGATDLGNYLVGVNCTLPPSAVINDMYIVWDADNGI